MMIRRTGYLPDPAGHRRTPFRALARRIGATAFPPSASLFEAAPPVMDQGQTGSCTGHATSTAIYIAGRLAWVPSPAEIYRNGRAIDRDDLTVALTDDGAQPNQVFRAVNEFGVRAMIPLTDRFSDADIATINDEPKLGDLEEESSPLMTTFVRDYGIFSLGAARLDDVCVALAAGRPVATAIAGGSDAFQSYVGGVLPALHAPLDHYVVLLGYETLANGHRVYHGRNSWSDQWGESGNFRIAQEAIAELSDLVVVEGGL